MEPRAAIGLVAAIAFGVLASTGAGAAGIAAAGAAAGGAAPETAATAVQYRTVVEDYAAYDRGYYGEYVAPRTWYERPRVRRYYYAEPAPRYRDEYVRVPEVVVRPRRPAPAYRERVYVYEQPAYRAYEPRGLGAGYRREPRYWRYESANRTRYIFDTNNYLGGTPNPPGPSLAPMNPPGCYEGASDRVECPGVAYGAYPYRRY